MAFFGRRIKPQGFIYHPRYWDEEKEEREARIRAAKDAARGDAEGIKNRISASFRRPRKYGKGGHQAARRKSNITVLVILVALLAMAVLLIREFLPQIERMMK